MNQRGIVYTFYSYKGGVGRSMALANVASLLAKWGRKVLVIDWDLEAPGLETYFSSAPSVLYGSRSEKPGVVDLITAYLEDSPFDWRESLLQAYPFDKGSEVSILTAGRDSTEYVPRLQHIDWDFLFNEKGFGIYLEQLREEWLAEFDYILIDSRTGITDIGGICTIHLPDILVLLFTANEQSYQGIADVMRRARERYATLPFDRVKLLGVPVPSRFENTTEYKLATEWKGTFAQNLAEIYADWLPDKTTPADVVEKLFLPYIPYWSFGEGLPVVQEGTTDPRTLGFAYGFLAKLLDNRLQWTNVVAEMFGVSEDRTPAMLNQEAESIYAELTQENQLLARKILTRLVQVSSPEDGHNTRRRVPLTEFKPEARPVIEALTNARLLKITPEESANRSTVEIVSDALIDGWIRLKDWITEDRDFLLWRQQLSSRIVEWEDSKRDKSALLNGFALVKAKQFLSKRKDDLNEPEIRYIDESLRESERLRYAQRKKQYYAAAAVIVLVIMLASVLYFRWAIKKKFIESVKSVAILPIVTGREGQNSPDAAEITKRAATKLRSVRPSLSLTVLPDPLDPATPPYTLSDAQEIGRNLKVNAAIFVTVLRQDDIYSVNATMTGTENNILIGEKVYPYKDGDIDDIATKISLFVLEALARSNPEIAQQLTKRETRNDEALALCWKGRQALDKRTRTDIETSITFFKQAIEKDPNYASAHAGLALAYGIRSGYAKSVPVEDHQQAKEHAGIALSLNPDLAEAHYALGYSLANYDYDWPRADSEFGDAMRLDPKSGMLLYFYAFNYLISQGRMEDAISRMKEAAEQLSPGSLIIGTNLGWTYYYAGNYDAAMSQYEKVLEQYPKFERVYSRKIEVYEQQGRYDEAIAQWQQWASLPEDWREKKRRQVIFEILQSGKARESAEVYWTNRLRMVEELKKDPESVPYLSYEKAGFYAMLGKKKEALALLQQAYQDRDDGLIKLAVNPRFKSLRSDKEFIDLVKKIGLKFLP